MNKAPIHLSGLNGLRAIAALSVVIGHVFQDTFGNWGISGLHLPIFKGGVTLFFVISGFLITYLLLQEKKNIQKLISLNIPNDAKDAEMALEESKEVYYRTLEQLANDTMINEAIKARDIEINRILQDRDARISKNKIIYEAQLALIEKLLGQC
jgi:hypothetical protein